MIQTDDVERVLTDIDADYGNRNLCCRSQGVLLVLAPLASLSLAGQEHGRTIPLGDMGHLAPTAIAQRFYLTPTIIDWVAVRASTRMFR